MYSISDLLSVPSPEDDDSDLARRVTLSVLRENEAHLLELASFLGYSTNLNPQSVIPILALCHGSSHQSLIVGCQMDAVDHRALYEYYIRMQRVGGKIRPTTKAHIIALSSQIGIDYRIKYLSESQ